MTAVEVPNWVGALKRDVEEQSGEVGSHTDGKVQVIIKGEAEVAAVILALEVLDRLRDEKEIREFNVNQIAKQINEGQGFNELSQGVLERFGRDLSMIRVLLEGK